MTLVHFDETVIHLMQLSLVISHCNITFLVFWLSQGHVATFITWGGWSSYCQMCRSFLNLTVKNALKSVDFWQSYRQKWTGSFFMARSVYFFQWQWLVDRKVICLWHFHTKFLFQDRTDGGRELWWKQLITVHVESGCYRNIDNILW